MSIFGISAQISAVFVLIICLTQIKENFANFNEFLKLNPPSADPLPICPPTDGYSFESAENGYSCSKKYFPNATSFVCVCDAYYCDEPEPVGNIEDGTFVVYTTTLLKDRFRRSTHKFVHKKIKFTKKKKYLSIAVNVKSKKQSIFGFGGAFTDAAGININLLSEKTQKKLLQSYFGDYGIGYTIGRVPIASCDFSTREYSYLEEPNDFDLKSFKLAEEDLKYKIPNILEAFKLSHQKLKLFASPWSAPGWMKTNGRMKGGGQLKGEFNGKYYQTYAKYFARFFDEYYKKGVKFWGLTIENEPGFGLDKDYRFQAMYMNPKMQRDFAYHLLSPTLKSMEASKNIKIMAHDDQRSLLYGAATEIFDDPVKSKAIDGFAFHWYSHSNFTTLTDTHNLNPDKFLLPTEACTGFRPSEQNVLLGNWERGLEFGLDILNDLNNWSIGWTDWNLALDMSGGPNWVNNFVDAPIIVNPEADEFYKQPMFYFIGHFSKFLPRGSVQIETELIELESSRNAGEEINFVSFKTPENNFVTVLINNSEKRQNIFLRDSRNHRKTAAVEISPRAITTIIWKSP